MSDATVSEALLRDAEEKISKANALHKAACAELRLHASYWDSHNAMWESYKKAKAHLIASMGTSNESAALRSFLAIDGEFNAMKSPDTTLGDTWYEMKNEAVRALLAAFGLKDSLPNDGNDR